jgi:hypothetical protein
MDQAPNPLPPTSDPVDEELNIPEADIPHPGSGPNENEAVEIVSASPSYGHVSMMERY